MTSTSRAGNGRHDTPGSCQEAATARINERLAQLVSGVNAPWASSSDTFSTSRSGTNDVEKEVLASRRGIGALALIPGGTPARDTASSRNRSGPGKPPFLPARSAS